MNDRDRTDLWTALVVGAVVGVGAALLLRAADEPETRGILRGLRPAQKQARRAVSKVGKDLGRSTQRLGRRGEELLDQGSDALVELRRDAARIVARARHELEGVARNSVKQARRTARQARRRFA